MCMLVVFAKFGRDSVKVSPPKVESLPTERKGLVWSEDQGRPVAPSLPLSVLYHSCTT